MRNVLSWSWWTTRTKPNTRLTFTLVVALNAVIGHLREKRLKRIERDIATLQLREVRHSQERTAPRPPPPPVRPPFDGPRR